MSLKTHVLVVDDELDCRGFLFALLDAEGYDVGTCLGPVEALYYVARNRPDLVVTDVRMPGMDGIELARRIREMSPHTRVLLISAYVDASMGREAREGGCGGVIRKPFSTKALLRAVRSELETEVETP